MTMHMQPALSAGAPLEQAAAAMVLVHGRGASAQSILSLASEWEDRGRWAYLAPQADNQTWYPRRFMEPIAGNQPWLDAALSAVSRTVDQVLAAGIPAERLVLLGFSQGACLAQEFAVRYPRRYGGIVGLSGGLIGPPGTSWEAYAPELGGTPAFLGCSDVDFHIPVERVYESAQVLEAHGAAVTTRIYPGMGHTVNQDEIAWIQGLVSELGR